MNLGHGGTWALLYLLSEWAIRVAMLVIVPVRRSPEAAKGWLLLAFFLPKASRSWPVRHFSLSQRFLGQLWRRCCQVGRTTRVLVSSA